MRRLRTSLHVFDQAATPPVAGWGRRCQLRAMDVTDHNGHPKRFDVELVRFHPSAACSARSATKRKDRDHGR